jgi:hypothetical protein
MFPKRGRNFRRATDLHAAYPESIGEVLRRELSNTHQAQKTLMRWTGANERTAKNWLAGANGPSGEHLLYLMRNSDPVFECVLQLAGRQRWLSGQRLLQVRNVLHETEEFLSGLLEEPGSKEDYERGGDDER